MLRKILPGLCLLVISSACFGSVITFGDLSGSGIAIPNGYAGFNWNNFDGMAGSFAPVADAAGASSAAQTFVVNHAEQAASFGSATGFTLTSAWLATQWNSQLSVEVIGLVDGKPMQSLIVDLRSGAPQVVTFSWGQIDEVRFVPRAQASAKGSMEFAVSDLVINQSNQSVPEPATFLLLAPGLGFAATKLRKLRLSKWLRATEPDLA